MRACGSFEIRIWGWNAALQHEASRKDADDPNANVGDETKTGAARDLAGKPSRDATDRR
jgi:hypothetical protein